MTISRNINGADVEIKLTPQEMYDAFVEQQHNIDVEDFLSYRDYMRCEGRIGDEEYERRIDEFADKYRELFDDYVSFVFLDYARIAINECLKS